MKIGFADGTSATRIAHHSWLYYKRIRGNLFSFIRWSDRSHSHSRSSTQNSGFGLMLHVVSHCCRKKVCIPTAYMHTMLQQYISVFSLYYMYSKARGSTIQALLSTKIGEVVICRTTTIRVKYITYLQLRKGKDIRLPTRCCRCLSCAACFHSFWRAVIINKLFVPSNSVRLCLPFVLTYRFLSAVGFNARGIRFGDTKQKWAAFDTKSKFWCTSILIEVAIARTAGQSQSFSFEVRWWPMVVLVLKSTVNASNKR